MSQKKGQNRTYDKEAFQTGLTEHGRRAALERASAWWSGGNGQSKKDRLNICRKKQKRKK